MSYTKKKVSALAGNTEVIFTQGPTDEQMDPPFRIISDRSGMRFEGSSCTITNVDELQEYASIVSDAWSAHLSLVPKIEMSTSGH